MPSYETTYIFFDTNTLEARFNGKQLFLSKIKLSNLYYDVENLIKSMELSERVKICIPEVVWMELLEHMHQSYISEKQSMIAKIDNFKKSMGDLVELNIEYKLRDNEKTYVDLLSTLSNEYLEDPKTAAQIVPCPKDENIINTLISKATHSISPFTKAKGKSKEYSDAGFKDALIFETMISLTGTQLGILITNDGDFENAFLQDEKDNLKCINSLEKLRDILVDNYGIVGLEYLESKFRNNDYLLKRILEESGLDEDVNYIFEKIDKALDSEEGKQIWLLIRINGDISRFVITYDDAANELCSAEYYESEDDYEETLSNM